jgi:hypothetical protein
MVRGHTLSAIGEMHRGFYWTNDFDRLRPLRDERRHIRLEFRVERRATTVTSPPRRRSLSRLIGPYAIQLSAQVAQKGSVSGG